MVFYHRIAEVGGDLWRLSGPTPTAQAWPPTACLCFMSLHPSYLVKGSSSAIAKKQSNLTNAIMGVGAHISISRILPVTAGLNLCC